MDIRDNIFGLQHIGLPSRDFHKTVAFYEELGFENVYQTVNEGVPVAFLRLGNVTLEAWQQDDARQGGGAFEHIALDVRDVDSLYKLALDRGYKIRADGLRSLPFWKNGVRFFNIEGPNRETVEFSQYL